MTLIISNATIIDGVSAAPFTGSIRIENRRIASVDPRPDIIEPPGAQVIDARGKFAIPGLMNANVHLFMAINLESVARYFDRIEDIIIESAQVALKSGLTTVYDTWGPRRHLTAVRDKINNGDVIGSRIYCAGNIIGFDGLFSQDFFPHALQVATSDFADRINSVWAEDVGRHLMWQTPERIGEAVRSYMARGIDFVKYASNDHAPGAFLAFSPAQQMAIVEEAHRAALTAQAHTMSVEGLRIALEAGCDLIQHANKTGPVPIPTRTLDILAKSRAGAVVFPHTEEGLAWIQNNVPAAQWTTWATSDQNARNIISAGAKLLLANDGAIVPREWPSDPYWGTSWVTAPDEFNLNKMATGHFVWLRAMEEKGCPPMELLYSATRNIAEAYGQADILGTLEPGKFADVVVLNANPLESAANYADIHTVIKAGQIVDREALPSNPVLTASAGPPEPEEQIYVPFLSAGSFPVCC